MELPVSEQLLQAASALLLGGALGLLYDVFRALRRLAGLEALWDLLFWLCALPALFTLGLAGPGGLRLFVLFAALLGAAVYFLVLSPAVLKGLLFCLGLVMSALRWCAYPITLLGQPVKKMAFFLRNVFKKMKKWFTIKKTVRLARRQARKRRPTVAGENKNETKKSTYYY